MKLKAVVWVACALAAAPVAAQQVTFMTGPQGGAWIPLGGALKGLWEKSIPGLSIQLLPGAGISNVRAIDEGKAHVGLANSSTTVDGLEGRPPYPRKVTRVCQVANLYPQYFQVVALANANVQSFADFRGKSLTTQAKGNTGELLTELVLRLNGLGYDSLARVNHNSYTESVALMKDGHAQIFTLGTTAPASAVMDLASARDIRLVPVDDRTINELRKMNAGYKRLVIKAGTYPKQDRDVPVIAYSTHLVVACDLAEDSVYRMAKTMAENVSAMTAVVKAMEGITPKDMALDIGVPFHKGALKFYREVGAL